VIFRRPVPPRSPVNKRYVLLLNNTPSQPPWFLPSFSVLSIDRGGSFFPPALVFWISGGDDSIFPPNCEPRKKCIMLSFFLPTFPPQPYNPFFCLPLLLRILLVELRIQWVLFPLLSRLFPFPTGESRSFSPTFVF